MEGNTVSADRRRLFLASFLMLFVELVLIRWLGAHIAYLSFFSNFVLLGSFLGIGIGFLAVGRSDWFRWAPLWLGALVFMSAVFPVTIDRRAAASSSSAGSRPVACRSGSRCRSSSRRSPRPWRPSRRASRVCSSDSRRSRPIDWTCWAA